jgi:hypothetical protein
MIDYERVGMNCETQISTSDEALMRKRYRWHKRDLRSSLSSLPQLKELPYTTCIISISEPFSFYFPDKYQKHRHSRYFGVSMIHRNSKRKI